MTRKDVTVEQVIVAFENGLNLNQCAELFNCSNTTIRNRLESAGRYTRKKTPQHARHGTRTMYVHYGCRCESCCKAEHEQYLKRPESEKRSRVYSKYSDLPYRSISKSKAKHDCDVRRREAINSRTKAHSGQIKWHEIADMFGMKCAICGIEVDPLDTWTKDSGRKCYGRRYPTVDHIVPIKHGGTDTFDNVQLLCKRCNSKKGANIA